MAATLAELRNLIRQKDYWNPRDPDFERRQRMVRDGFQKLYPRTEGAGATFAATGQPQEPRSPDEERQETIRQLKERWEEVLEEYGDLLKTFWYPVPDHVEQRKKELEGEREEIERELEKYGETPGVQMKL